jgi:hypothetical protein
LSTKTAFAGGVQEDKLYDIPASLLKDRKKVAASKDLLKALLKVVRCMSPSSSSSPSCGSTDDEGLT